MEGQPVGQSVCRALVLAALELPEGWSITLEGMGHSMTLHGKMTAVTFPDAEWGNAPSRRVPAWGTIGGPDRP